MKDIAVIYGGPGKEQKISIHSAQTIFQFFKKEKINFKKCFISDLSDLKKVIKLCKKKSVLVIVHGENGEGGIIQKELSKNNIQYFGNNFGTLAKTFDKKEFYKICKTLGVTFPMTIALNKRNYDNFWVLFKKSKIQFPFILKPSKGSSSIGLKLISTYKDLEKIILQSILKFNEVLIQEFVEGGEYNCTVYRDGKQVKVLGVSQVKIPKDSIYTYTSKYLDKNIKDCVITKLSVLYLNISKISKKLYKKLQLKSVVRFDFRVDKNGNVYVLEVNSFPVIGKHNKNKSNDFVIEQLRKSGIDERKFFSCYLV